MHRWTLTPALRSGVEPDSLATHAQTRAQRGHLSTRVHPRWAMHTHRRRPIAGRPAWEQHPHLLPDAQWLAEWFRSCRLLPLCADTAPVGTVWTVPATLW